MSCRYKSPFIPSPRPAYLPSVVSQTQRKATFCGFGRPESSKYQVRMLCARALAMLLVQCAFVCQSNELLWSSLRSVPTIQPDRQSCPASFGPASRTLSRSLLTSTAVVRAPFGLRLRRRDVRNAFVVLSPCTSTETLDPQSCTQQREGYLLFGLRR